jgi:hypothetical protein
MKHVGWAAALVAIVLTACTSTGSVVTTDITVTKTVTLQTPMDPEVAIYAPRFISALEKQGFKVGESKDPHAMQLRLDFNGNLFNTRVAAELWHDGAPILTASATNSGWGTAIAHGEAVENLANAAVAMFGQKLSQLRPHVRIIEEPSEPQKKATTDL